MKVILRTADIDNIYYLNNFQNVPTTNTTNIKGFANQFRTKFIYKNINLPLILGKEFRKNKNIINIKVVEIKIINENGNTNPIDVINSQSLGIYRTSNIFMYSDRLIPINGLKEILIGQLTNFDPNEEFILEKCQFIRGDQVNFQHTIGGSSTVGGLELLNFHLKNNPFIAWSFIYRNTTNLDLVDKQAQITSSTISGSNINLLVQSIYGSNLPTRVNVAFNNTDFDMYVIPNNLRWTTRKYNDDEELNYLCDYSFFIPEDNNIDLYFEIRDIQNNELQPILGNNIYFPSISIVLDIY